ncbi:MAG: methylenetetrahydrofolate reductase [NAD(P)H] [Pseudomonadota bacterium]
MTSALNLTAMSERVHPLSLPHVSFEFFPPKSRKMEGALWREIKRLEPLAPRFVSVTFGAGGGTRDTTQATVTRIRQETRLQPAAHLTCVGLTTMEVDDIARCYWEADVKHIIALRGDLPGDGSDEVVGERYHSAADLVAGLREVADFDISVAAYPEVHPDAASPGADLDNLKRKLDAGASRAITQFFFDPDLFLDFVERARAAGITAPIVPGILPVTNIQRTISFAERCGATVPGWLIALFDGIAPDDEETTNLVGAVAAAELCRYLQARGIEEFHFYTLNRADLTTAICRILQTPVLTTP